MPRSLHEHGVAKMKSAHCFIHILSSILADYVLLSMVIHAHILVSCYWCVYHAYFVALNQHESKCVYVYFIMQGTSQARKSRSLSQGKNDLYPTSGAGTMALSPTTAPSSSPSAPTRGGNDGSPAANSLEQFEDRTLV